MKGLFFVLVVSRCFVLEFQQKRNCASLGWPLSTLVGTQLVDWVNLLYRSGDIALGHCGIVRIILVVV